MHSVDSGRSWTLLKSTLPAAWIWGSSATNIYVICDQDADDGAIVHGHL